MDPITAIGLIGTIAQLINSTAQVIGYISDVHHATKESIQFAQEASDIFSLLLKLKSYIEDPQTPKAQSLGALTSHLNSLNIVLHELAKKLQPLSKTQKSLQKLFWTRNKKDILDILGKIERIKSLISLAIGGDILELAKAIKSDTSSISSISLSVRAIREGVDDVKRSIRAQEDLPLKNKQQDIIRHIAPFDFSTKQYDVFADRMPGTGTWFLESPRFCEWIEEPGATLWCPGIPGAGKTMIASIVIDSLNRRFDERSDITTLYVYCDYGNNHDQSADNLVASLWRQLVQKRTMDSAECHEYDKVYVSVNRRPRIDEISTMVYSEMKLYSRIFIVVDAWDECLLEHRKPFLEALKGFQSVASLMITSRIDENQSEDSGALKHVITLPILASKEDLQSYIQGRVLAGSRLNENVKKSPVLMESIIDKVGERCQGMFLLAKMHMDALADMHTPKTIRKALTELPNGENALNESYDKAIARIEGQNKNDRILAERVLAWVSYAVSGMQLKELQHALSIDYDDEDLEDEDVISERLLTSVCAGLVSIEQRSGIVRFVHYTTLEYFQVIRAVKFPGAHRDITRTCLTYLRFPSLSVSCMEIEQEMEKTKQRYPFLRYASVYWGAHAQVCLPQDCMEEVLEFLRLEGNVACAAQVLASSIGLGLLFPHHFNPGTRTAAPTTGLSLAAYFGLYDVVHELLHRPNMLSNSLDSFIGTALHWASAGNGTSALTLLLDQTEAVRLINCTNLYEFTPIHIAILYGSHDCLKLLLARGADILKTRNTNGYSSSSLRIAVENGRTDIITTVIEADKERKLLKTRDNWRSIPLHLAAVYNLVDVTKLLLQYHAEAYGADLFKDVDDLYKQNPLHTAARWGSSECARVLLAHDRSFDLLSSFDQNGETPLHAAVRGGKSDVVRAFLDHPLKRQLLETKSGQDTVLQLSAKLGRADVFDLLLKNSTSGLSVGANGRTILHDAATSGSFETLRVALKNESLLQFLDAHDQDGMTPLHLVCAEGCTELIEELIRCGADLNVKNHASLTPLHIATEADFDIVVAILVKARCLVHVQSIKGATPIDIGLRLQSSRIVGILLEAGATLPAELDDATKGWAECQKWWPGSQTDDQSSFVPETAYDIFHAAFCMKVASGLPTRLINRIMDMAEYWIQSTSFRRSQVLVTEADLNNIIYLQTEPIVGGAVRPVRQITFTISSHDQGSSDDRANWSTPESISYVGSYTFFEAWKQAGPMKTPGVEILRNAHARWTPTTHSVVWPRQAGFHFHGNEAQAAEWVVKLQAGDRVLLVPKAQFRGWRNYVLSAKVTICTTYLRQFVEED